MANIAMRYGQAGARTAQKGSSWKLLGSTNITVNTSSTTATNVGTYTLPASWTDAKIIMIRVRDQAGKRAGYFYGHDTYFTNYRIPNGSTSSLTTAAHITYAYTSGNAWYEYSGQYGVWGYQISSAGVITFRARYNSTYSLTINGTYTCDVFALDYADGETLFK